MDQWIVVRAEDVQKILAQEPKQGKQLLPWGVLPEGIKLPFNILESVEVSNIAEVHETEGDYWECLEGEVTFVCGGKLINPRATKAENGKTIEWKGEGIEGGKEVVLKAGDRLWIPLGVPHTHNKPQGSVRLMITKIR